MEVVSTSLKVVSTSLKVVSTLLNDNEVVKCVIVRGIISSVIKSTFILKIQTISHTMLVTYQLILWHTPWSRDLLEKLTGSQVVNKFPAFYGTWRFITAFTSDRHVSLSWVRSVQTISVIFMNWINMPLTWKAKKISSNPGWTLVLMVDRVV